MNNSPYPYVVADDIWQLLPPCSSKPENIVMVSVLDRGDFSIYTNKQSYTGKHLYKINYIYIYSEEDHDPNTTEVFIRKYYKQVKNPIEYSSTLSLTEIGNFIYDNLHLEKTHTRIQDDEGVLFVNFPHLEKNQGLFEFRLTCTEKTIITSTAMQNHVDNYIDEKIPDTPVFSVNCLTSSVYFNIPIFLDQPNIFSKLPDFLLNIYFEFLNNTKKQIEYATEKFNRFYNALGDDMKLLYEGKGL